ncbi:hypothetical protein XENOCAPTIV_001211 [Xenoophorus captivus]|uniref:Protein Wnt n=1 Tax=Xenoophorus captivus TaxID=1517983 RepID=A0ABV0R3Z6_9TELE
MRKVCKCHGVSGSCSIQTCWMQLADFREVGNYLRIKHQHARKLEMDKKPMKAGNSAGSRRAIAHAFRGISRTELVYLEDSPNYCIKNQSLGVQGTEGRECLKGHRNMSQWERRSCRRLCYECGLRVVAGVGYGAAAVTTWILVKGFPNSTWMRRRQGRTQERQLICTTTRQDAQCHGMSESCSLQTCWTQLSDFREIGNYLKIKYNQARKLDIDKKRVRAGNSADSRGAIVDAFGHVAQTELIYMEDSPDYCRRNASLGLHGTEGRECLQHGADLTQWERRSCRRLCHECGLRVEERRTEVVSSCNCKFHWCCRVNCEDCSEIIVKHVCAKKEVGEGYTFRKHIGPK